jgi:hypothetical protein
MSIAVQAAATTTDLPFAAAMFSFFRSLGQTFGIAVGGMNRRRECENEITVDSTICTLHL